MNNFLSVVLSIIKERINYLNPLKLSYAANDQATENYFFAKGSSPASNLRTNQNMPSNQGNNDGTEQSGESTGSANNTESRTGEQTPSSQEENSEKKESSEEPSKPEDLVDEAKKNLKEEAKKKLKELTIYNPQFYLYFSIALAIFFFILFIVVLFWQTSNYPTAILCGGPSRLDSMKVITTDQGSHDAPGSPRYLFDGWDFYEYVGAVLNNELKASGNETTLIPHQVQAIAVASYGLSVGFANIENNKKSYKNSWCPPFTEEEKSSMVESGVIVKRSPNGIFMCPVNWPEEPEIILIKNSIDNQTACDPKTGCCKYINEEERTSNAFEGLFGIKEGKCLNTNKSRTEGAESCSGNLEKWSRWCSVKEPALTGNYFGDDPRRKKSLQLLKKYVNVSRETIDNYEHDAKTFLLNHSGLMSKDGFPINVSYGDGGAGSNEYKVEVIAKVKKMPAASEESQLQYKAITDSIRGVLMVTESGWPGCTQYKSGDEPACLGTDAYANNPPTRTNAMCHAYDAELSIHTQTHQRYWPVHKILTFWYDFHLASWSSSGIAECEIYHPISENTKILNYQDTPPDYVIDHNATVLTIFGDRYRSQRQVEFDFNYYISSQVTGAKLGTGRGVATAAVALLNLFEQKNYRVPYSFGGTYKDYGINRLWGSPTPNTYGEAPPNTTIPLGFDCMGFAHWVFRNGGLNDYISFGPMTKLKPYDLNRYYDGLHSNVGLHGDAIYHGSDVSGGTDHVKVIIGMVYDDNGVLVGNLVAHAQGSSVGVVVQMVSVITGNPITSSKDANGKTVFTEHPLTLADPYGVIDFSNCYEQYGHNGKIKCTIADPADYYKGKLEDGRGGRL